MSDGPFKLTGLDGTNPLGFLAALGTLVILERNGQRGARLRWVLHHTWIPVLDQVAAADGADLARVVADGLRGRVMPKDVGDRQMAARRAMEMAKTAVKKRRDEIRRRKLSRAELAEARDRELRPLEEEARVRQAEYAKALRSGTPRAELALGKRIEDATPEYYRQMAEGLLANADCASRDELDQLAALASEASLNRGRLQPTPFEFARGSGHQFFLEFIRQLMDKVTPQRVHEVLFHPWTYCDEGLSLRWDPMEDRRYALMDEDPTSAGNKPTTMWMANLLAYRALALFPTARGWRGLAVVAWNLDREPWTFTWPLWRYPATFNTVISLLRLRELADERPDAATLRARGVGAVYRAERIQVGQGANSKLNFSPARAVL